MATTASGLTIPGSSPTTTPATPVQDHWNNLGLSLNGKVVGQVANTTARAALVTALAAEGYTPSAARPIIVWRADADPGRQLEYTINGTSWGLPNRAISSKGTANISGITTETVIASGSAVTGDGFKRFRISGSFYALGGTVATDVFEVYLKDSTLGTVLGTWRILIPASPFYADGRNVMVSDVPAIGSHVYQMTVARTTGTGTGIILAGASDPVEIIVEQIA